MDVVEADSLSLHTQAVGRPPGTLTVPPGALPSRISMTRYDAERVEVFADVAVARLRELVRGDKVYWIDVTGLGTLDVFERLMTDFGVPRLALEDVLLHPSRPKSEPYEGNARFLVLRMLNGRGPEGMEQISIYAQGPLVVTFQERPGDCFDAVRRRIEVPESLTRQSGPDYLLYRLVDACVDSFFPELDRSGQVLEQLDEIALRRPTADLLKRLHGARRELRALERACLPMREAIVTLGREGDRYFTPATLVFLRDAQDHATLIVEHIEHNSRLAEHTGQLVIELLNLRMNQVMKVLASVSLVFLPISFLAGLYGMNFDGMHELRWRYSYPLLLLLMATIALTTFAWLWRRGWTKLEVPK